MNKIEDIDTLRKTTYYKKIAAYAIKNTMPDLLDKVRDADINQLKFLVDLINNEKVTPDIVSVLALAKCSNIAACALENYYDLQKATNSELDKGSTTVTYDFTSKSGIHHKLEYHLAYIAIIAESKTIEIANIIALAIKMICNMNLDNDDEMKIISNFMYNKIETVEDAKKLYLLACEEILLDKLHSQGLSLKSGENKEINIEGNLKK